MLGGKAEGGLERSTWTLAHAVQMLKACLCDPLELETGSCTWRGTTKASSCKGPSCTSAAHAVNLQSWFISRALLQPSPGELSFVGHKFHIAFKRCYCRKLPINPNLYKVHLLTYCNYA